MPNDVPDWQQTQQGYLIRHNPNATVQSLSATAPGTLILSMPAAQWLLGWSWAIVNAAATAALFDLLGVGHTSGGVVALGHLSAAGTGFGFAARDLPSPLDWALIPATASDSQIDIYVLTNQANASSIAAVALFTT